MNSLFSWLFPSKSTLPERSPFWPKIRAAHLLKEPDCQICGNKDKSRINVHHKKPYHLYPSLELEASNLVTLCEADGMNCHITFGHLGNWKSWNPDVDKDVSLWRLKVRNRPVTHSA